MTELLTIRGLTRDFGGFRAVDGVDLDVAQGAIHSVIGPNGAGKSTLFSLITGERRPTAGTVRFDGRDLTGLAPHAVTRAGLAKAFQTTSIFPRLTVGESVCAALAARNAQLRLLRSRTKAGIRAEAETICGALGLAEHIHRAGSALSHGDQRALEVALALATAPRLLLLDEPTAGMSPFETKRVVDQITGLARERGLTVLFSEHDLDTVFSISDEVTVMHQGRVLAHGPAAEVRANDEVMAVYLGSEP
ncbi:ABC transporter ATP-binding protein [Actinospica sp. MGRD01-02]|uniref:ABC transporter ATP-binding protein n=1 Tax=Actinospica acidithermotolerans TaxID=2828514 RepID=A0A941EC51_9ACTN|nr:ABC transporter ATP-binding protein [Actinospica acidithermotolerans]MBR7827650.1 ABC transporter ATP-binding protein [Actinospica acidithermotolerans]